MFKPFQMQIQNEIMNVYTHKRTYYFKNLSITIYRWPIY